jgi:selenocysteine-specific elongation factor
MTSLALSRALGVPEMTLVRLFAIFVDDGRLAHRAGYYATPPFVPRLTNEQQTFFERLFAGNTQSLPLAFEDVTAAMRAAKIAGLAQAFDTLQTSGALVKVDGAVYRGEQIAHIRLKLETALRRDKQLTMAGFRDLIGTSRKFAVPLLEWFDASGVTIRSGDVRLLRIVPQRPAVKT